jgi:hypothetical protein
MNKLVVLTLIVACIGVSAPGGDRGAKGMDSRDTLLAALGKATLDCVATVGPSTYQTASGRLARTFTSCSTGDRTALGRVDALLGAQTTAQGRDDDLSGHYVGRWNAFIRSFPSREISECPTWSLDAVLDAPTMANVARVVAQKQIGEENARYTVSSARCAGDGACAVKAAVTCVAGFGPGFVIGGDPVRSQVDVDPAWWLTTYEFEDDSTNPFRAPGYYHAMSYYGAPPGALYGALERAGEACSQWDEISGTHFTDRMLVPIDCGGGWYCMTYCTLPVWAYPNE